MAALVCMLVFYGVCWKLLIVEATSLAEDVHSL